MVKNTLMLKLYNTRTKEKQEFTYPKTEEIGLYTCGPTVYHYAHIGNLRSFVFEDILKRVLKYNGYSVNHIMNITDVGHLTDDADAGEDKMEKGSRREGVSAWEIAKRYEEAFHEDINELNILPAKKYPRATEHIAEQIEMVDSLTEKGFTYETKDGIYFDTTKVSDYGALGNLQNQTQEAGKRVDMGEKRNQHDFALWKFSPEGEQRQMEWESPFSSMAGQNGIKGFPGWHIECSAMSVKYLGEQFALHCGGIDHMTVHHPNEIAQTEAFTGKKPWVDFWLHNEHLMLTGKDEDGNPLKMSKSTGDFLTLSKLKEKGFTGLDYRYYLLQSHYRKQMHFSFEALGAAQNALKKLRKQVHNIDPKTPIDPKWEELFLEAINDDMNTPQALAVLWEGIKAKTLDLKTIIAFDKVLGLNLHNPEEEKEIEIPKDVQTLLDERKLARENKDWSKSDELRDKMKELGFIVEDTNEGQKLTLSE